MRITDFSITEEAFDPALNPIRAKVSLGMRVLSVDDLGFDSKGGSLFMSYQQQKEQLAAGAARATLSTLGIWEASHDRSERRSCRPCCTARTSGEPAFPPTSRYHGVATPTRRDPTARTLVYLRRRFVPPPERFAAAPGAHRGRRASVSTTWPRSTSATRSSSGGCATPTRRCGREELTETLGRQLRITLPRMG